MVLAVILSFLFLIFPLTITDKLPLHDDRDALLTFKRGLPKSGKLDWDDKEYTCTWQGIKCQNVTKYGKHSMVSCTNVSNPRSSIYKECQIRVARIDLPAAGLFGPIVANSIGKLEALQVLNLRSNLLYGTLPPDIFYLDNLNYLILSNNSFCGDIPRFKQPLPPNLMSIDLSYNSFTGHIPPEFSWLRRLVNLTLQNNTFMGQIPDDINLTRRGLFGDKVHLNLSYNLLEGQIPYTLQRLKFSADSFMGNPRLCGSPLLDCTLLAPAPAPLTDIAPILVVPYSVFMAYLLIHYIFQFEQ